MDDKRIIVFYGSKSDFEKMLEEEIQSDVETITFMSLIQHYNARIRPSESGVQETALRKKIQVDNCVVRAEDYASVLEHALSNFVNIVTLNHEIKTLFIHNPPKRVIRSLISIYQDSIEYRYSNYKPITQDILKEIYKNLNVDILGQDKCKKQIISGLYRLTKSSGNRPVVLMFFGPSGVGKTETAKSISKTLGGDLLRIQFSMMQSGEAYNYIFGAEHSKSSFARDMMSRESNVILIDEFDKVNPIFYNAFYELFDEGRYVDTNYEVDLKKTIFICTCNFMSEDEIRKVLGPAMYSRIGCCIEYDELTSEQKWLIIESWYRNIIGILTDEEKDIIQKTDILAWFKANAKRFDNIRILKTKIENAIFDELTDIFIISRDNPDVRRGKDIIISEPPS